MRPSCTSCSPTAPSALPASPRRAPCPRACSSTTSCAGCTWRWKTSTGASRARTFPDAPGGNLYKEIWPNPAFSDAELRAALQTNEERGDVSGLRAFADAVGRLQPGADGVELRRFIEVEPLLRYLAVDRALRNWDGVTAFYSPRSSHNFYWYEDDGPARQFHLIPWDLDGTFGGFHPYAQPQQWVTAPPVPDLNERPRSCEPRVIWDSSGSERILPPRCDKLLSWLIQAH